VSLHRKSRKTVISDEEFQGMMDRTRELEPMFYRLRTRALLALFYLTGKRRSELVRLEVDDFKEKDEMLQVTFTLSKKRRESVITKRATKSIPLSDPLTQPILEYLDYLETLNPKPQFFLPRTVLAPGSSFTIMSEASIGGRQLLNLIRQVSDEVWPHLFRETQAAQVVQQDSSILGAYKVKERLNLESVQTGFRYLERYATDIIRREIVEEKREKR
jgi:integrase